MSVKCENATTLAKQIMSACGTRREAKVVYFVSAATLIRWHPAGNVIGFGMRSVLFLSEPDVS